MGKIGAGGHSLDELGTSAVNDERVLSAGGFNSWDTEIKEIDRKQRAPRRRCDLLAQITNTTV